MVSAIFTPCSIWAQHVDETIIVTATPGNQSAGELAQSVTVLSGGELDRVRAVNLGETLESQLGMSASYFGAGSSRPIIRGLAGARVRTLEDSIAVMDVSTISVDHAVGVDPLVARQVEIFRGPTTLLYGSGAVGGIVNTVTDRIPEFAPEDGFDAAFELRGDTVADERTLALVLDGGQTSFAWHVDVADRETGNYEIPGFSGLDQSASSAPGLLLNSGLDLQSYSIGGSWLGDSHIVGLSISDFETNYGIPSFESGEEAIRIDLEQSRVDLKGNWLDLSGFVDAINVRFGVNDYEHIELEGEELGTRFENDAYEGRVELIHAPVGKWSGAFGLQFSEREFSAIGDEAFVPPVKTSNAGIFVVERIDTGPWGVELGARYETQEHRPSGASDVDNSAVSFSVAAIRDLNDGFSLAVNVASAERSPAAEELFANGPHLATNSIELGDAALRNETSRHVDLTLRKTVGDLTWSVTAFTTDYDKFIYLQDTGFDDPVEGLPIRQFSQRDADFSGVEAEVFAPLAQMGEGELDIRLFSDFVRAKLDNGEKVPRIPPLRVGAGVNFHTDSFSVGFEVIRYDSQNDIAPNETPTGGYTLVGFDLDWQLTPEADREFSIYLRGSNLLDTEARRHTSLVKNIAPLPGRNLAFGLRAAF